MGKMIDGIYKTIYEIPEEEGTLRVIMETKSINQESFNAKANKKNVLDISILAASLSQTDFNNLVIVIHNCTDKNTNITFVPEVFEGEELAKAYDRYVEGYRNQLPDTPKHFPENIFITGTAISVDDVKDNYIKKNHI